MYLSTSGAGERLTSDELSVILTAGWRFQRSLARLYIWGFLSLPLYAAFRYDAWVKQNGGWVHLLRLTFNLSTRVFPL